MGKQIDYLQKIWLDFELHSVEGIQDCFSNGVDPNGRLHGKPLIEGLVNMYTRSPKFKGCVRAFVEAGLVFDDKVLLAVLLDDAEDLDLQLTRHPRALAERYTFQSAFTPLYQVSLLHICAEYNHCYAAQVLVKHGADINGRAGVDELGFGAHSPIFHTVNQHENISLEMLKFLLENKADLAITVPGLIWGKGYEWETFVPAVNPISYAMMGLLRQFQRNEQQVYTVVELLLAAEYGIRYFPPNVPNKYLTQ